MRILLKTDYKDFKQGTVILVPREEGDMLLDQGRGEITTKAITRVANKQVESAPVVKRGPGRPRTRKPAESAA